MKIDPQKQLKGENPVFSFPDTLNNGSGNKSISNSPQYQPDNLQSTFPLPEGGRVTVEILYSDAAENSQINLELRQPNQETLLEYANHNPGFTWVSPDYFTNTNFEIGIYWYWENEGTLYQGVEAGVEVSSLGSDEYYIGFEAAGDDWDYNELVVRVKIETYLPIVFIDPSNISTGETATVSVKKQFYDGRIEDFDAGQLFEFGMMEGCTAGALISGTDTSNYFNGVPQPVTFLAADSLENEEETVKIGVGVVEQNPTAKFQVKTNPLAKSKNHNIKVNGKNDDTKIDETKINSIIIGSCFGGDFNSDKRGDENLVVVGNECDEEIVVCDSFEPQKFDDPGVGKIEKLISNAPWNWIDPVTKTPKNTDAGEGCNRGKSSTDVGLTYVMSEIGPFSQSTPSVIYQLSEDIIIEACLDDRNPNEKLWRFKIKNVRVPIFVDVCSTFISNRNFIDLGDATDFSLLGSHITNCIEFRKVLADLDWEISGGDYSFPCVIRTSKYLFSTAIREHEEKHFQDKTYYIKKELDENTLLQLQQMTRKKDDYPCPEAVLGPDNSGKTKRELFKSLISARIIKGANIDLHMGTSPVPCGIPPSMPVYFQFNSELEANKSTKKFVLASLFGGKCNLGMIRCIS
ncbi:MAG: hypothetical protein HND40_11160 [Ignavibacteriota bacterium]|nr:hypothetical protein [Ignavibacterium album]QKK00089.1 MAG: hypothetical protein HND40_11160 [Ignavibacteriota bacterium]